jgi:hypothetical protein
MGFALGAGPPLAAVFNGLLDAREVEVRPPFEFSLVEVEDDDSVFVESLPSLERFPLRE